MFLSLYLALSLSIAPLLGVVNDLAFVFTVDSNDICVKNQNCVCDWYQRAGLSLFFVLRNRPLIFLSFSLSYAFLTVIQITMKNKVRARNRKKTISFFLSFFFKSFNHFYMQYPGFYRWLAFAYHIYVAWTRYTAKVIAAALNNQHRTDHIIHICMCTCEKATKHWSSCRK